MSNRYIKAKYIIIDIIIISTLCNKFEELVEKSFIIPKEINKDIKNMALLNMNRKIFSEEEIKIKKEKIKEKNIKKELNNKNETTDKYYEEYVDELGIAYKIPKNVKFGMHINDSFFEIYARENVFQLFNYSIMKYMKYKFELNDDEELDEKANKLIFKEMKKENLQYIPLISGNNDNMKVNNISKESFNKSEILIDTKENIPEKNNSKQQEKEDEISLKKCDVPKNKIGKSNKNTDNNIQSNLKKIKFSGDFDFILPGLKKEDLKNVIENKDISPFIFYGRIDLNNNKEFDVIGEIKENFHNTLFKKDQMEKYFQMIKLFKKEINDNIQFERFGFRSKRTKILMYVFDTTYSWFLKNMLDYRINQEKFTNADNNYKNESLYKSICNSFNNNNNIDDEKWNFIRMIVDSQFPFIFLYLPDVIKVDRIKFKEIEELREKIDILEKQILKKNLFEVVYELERLKEEKMKDLLKRNDNREIIKKMNLKRLNNRKYRIKNANKLILLKSGNQYYNVRIKKKLGIYEKDL